MSSGARIGDLTDALKQFLHGLKDTLSDSRSRFHSLVAVDLVRQLEAEIDHGSSLARARQSLVRHADTKDEAELVAAIRARRVDCGELRAVALRALADELALLRPKFDRRLDIRSHRV